MGISCNFLAFQIEFSRHKLSYRSWFSVFLSGSSPLSLLLVIRQVHVEEMILRDATTLKLLDLCTIFLLSSFQLLLPKDKLRIQFVTNRIPSQIIRLWSYASTTASSLTAS